MIRIIFRGGRNRGESDSDTSDEEERELLQHEDHSSADDSISDGGSQEEHAAEEEMPAVVNERNGEEEEMEVDDTQQQQQQSMSKTKKKEDKKKKQKKQRKDYDKSLPAQHLYLGELEEEGVASVQEEESTSILPLLYVPERVLFPGETLPMHIYNPHAITLLRRAFAEHKPVAVCTDLRGYVAHMDSHRPKQSELSIVGTTADIVACKEEEDLYWFHGPRFVVKLMGRQRFQVLEVFRRTNGMMDCQIRILPEVLMTPRPPQLLSCPGSIAYGHVSTILHSHQPEATMDSVQRAFKSRKRLWCPSSMVSTCSAPGWVLRMYDFDYLREKVLEAQHMQTITNEDKTVLPSDVTSLSYWLARRLPVDDTTKLQLLKMNCPTMRIIQGLRMLNEFTELYCERCEAVIAKKEHVFSMSVDGPLAAYVNPGGVVHDTLTVLQATNMKKVGSGTTEDSWFPGYQWTIVYCRQCRDHKGWFFEAVKKDLNPKSFFGLRRTSLSLFKRVEQPTATNESSSAFSIQQS